MIKPKYPDIDSRQGAAGKLKKSLSWKQINGLPMKIARSFKNGKLTKRINNEVAFSRRTLFFPARARLAGARFVQGFAAFADDEVNEDESGQGIGPPPAEERVERETDEQRDGHIGASHAARGVGFESDAADAPSDTQFALPE